MSIFFSDSFWWKVWGQPFTIVGLVTFVILTLLALTSHPPAMRLLGRHWKRLHRLVYLAGLLVVLHSIYGIITWQDIPNYDIALLETQIYGIQIVVLLLLRLEAVRGPVRQLLRTPKRKRA